MVKFREKREEYLNKLEGVSEKSGIFPAPGRRVASGEWRVARGEWRVASGEWRVASNDIF